MSNNANPVYSFVPCTDPYQGAKILCNGHPYLRTDMANIPVEEHNEMAEEIVADLNSAHAQPSIIGVKR